MTEWNCKPGRSTLLPPVAAYARVKNLELDDARLQSLEYLGLVRIKDVANQVVDPLKPQVKLLSADRFEVTAPKFYFESLPGLIRSLELGKKTVLVECQIWAVDDTIQQEARKFLIADSIHHIGGQIPQSQIDDPALKMKSGPYEVASTMRTSTSLPSTIAQLDQDNFERLHKLVSSRKNCSVRTAPSITMLPGQDASVQDGAHRPFVVGVEKVKGDFVASYQPMIQTVEDGSFIKVNCVPVDGSFDMNCTLAFAKVTDVGTAVLEQAPQKTGGQVTVQTPSQQVREVSVSLNLEEGKVLFIDPYHKETTVSHGKNGREVTQQHNLIAVVRAIVIDDE